MKALIKKFKRKGLWLEEIEKPKIDSESILVKISKTAICGTDIHIYNWNDWAKNNVPTPMQIGHEWVGKIEEVGDNVSEFKVGERVSGEGHIVCGLCRNCRAGKRHLCIHQKGIGIALPGAFAEYLKIPATNVFRVPESISNEVAAIFDPLGNAVHTALSWDLVGEDILITGAGPIGIMAAVIAKHAGARHVVITDINPYRLKLAKKLGIANTINVKDKKIETILKKLGMTEGFDIGLEMSGSPKAFQNMINLVNNGAKIALLGILPDNTKIPWSKVIFKDLYIKGIYGREIFETWYKMASMLESGLEIEKIITHRFHYSEFEKGFNIVLKGLSGKVILEWGD